jgi:peptidoglycan/LPS O-acetylase OafA/YrhL
MASEQEQRSSAPTASDTEPATASDTPSDTARDLVTTEPATARRSTSDRIIGADGVRALAALGVIFSHLYQRLFMPGQVDWYQDAQAVFMHGAYGVSTFFVLSGMLLSYPFWKAYLTGAPFPSVRHYVRRRAARIIPGYYASLLVSFGLMFLVMPDAPY